MTLLNARDQDPKSMVGRNKSKEKILMQVARKFSISKGVATTTNNVVVLETHLGGGGSSKSTSAMREC